MPNARIIDAGDGIVTLLGVLATDATITRGNVPVWERGEMSGPYIWVFDLKQTDAERITRTETIREYEFGIVYAKEYDTATAPNVNEPVPTSWTDTEKYYVEQKVFDVINLKSNRLLSSALYPWLVRYEPENQMYDEALLLEQKLFRSEVRAIYRELVTV